MLATARPSCFKIMNIRQISSQTAVNKLPVAEIKFYIKLPLQCIIILNHYEQRMMTSESEADAGNITRRQSYNVLIYVCFISVIRLIFKLISSYNVPTSSHRK